MEEIDRYKIVANQQISDLKLTYENKIEKM